MFQEGGGMSLSMCEYNDRRMKVSVWNLREVLVSRSFSEIGVLGRRLLQVRSSRLRWRA